MKPLNASQLMVSCFISFGLLFSGPAACVFAQNEEPPAESPEPDKNSSAQPPVTDESGGPGQAPETGAQAAQAEAQNQNETQQPEEKKAKQPKKNKARKKARKKAQKKPVNKEPSEYIFKVAEPGSYKFDKRGNPIAPKTRAGGKTASKGGQKAGKGKSSRKKPKLEKTEDLTDVKGGEPGKEDLKNAAQGSTQTPPSGTQQDSDLYKGVAY